MEIGYIEKVSRTQASKFPFFWDELRQISRWFPFTPFLFRGHVLSALVEEGKEKEDK